MSNKLLLKEMLPFIEAGADGEVLMFDSTKQYGFTMQALSSAIQNWPAAVSATEVGYLDGVTSAIQTQITAKATATPAGIGAAIAGGTAAGTDTYTLTTTVAYTAYTANSLLAVKFTNANTGAATININSLGDKALEYKGAALSANLIDANMTVLLWYDGTAFQIIAGA